MYSQYVHVSGSLRATDAPVFNNPSRRATDAPDNRHYGRPSYQPEGPPPYQPEGHRPQQHSQQHPDYTFRRRNFTNSRATDHEVRIARSEETYAAQKDVINQHTTSIDKHAGRMDAQDGRMDAQDGRMDAQDGRSDAQDEVIKEHTGVLERLQGGLMADFKQHTKLRLIREQKVAAYNARLLQEDIDHMQLMAYSSSRNRPAGPDFQACKVQYAGPDIKEIGYERRKEKGDNEGRSKEIDDKKRKEKGDDVGRFKEIDDKKIGDKKIGDKKRKERDDDNDGRFDNAVEKERKRR